MIHKTYAINLTRRPDKREHMQKEFMKLNSSGIEINPVFFEAIDGNNAKTLSEYHFHVPAWFDPNTGKAMTNGEVGCALSHYLVWKEIITLVENGTLPTNSRVLILEDDVIFLEDFMDKFDQYTNEVPNLEYDLLYVHRKPLDLINETKISFHISKPNKSYWACAYVVTYEGAKKLANDRYLQNLIPVDEYLPIMYGCKVLGYEKIFDDCEKLKCYAICPSLLKLKGDAFNDSETYHSKPFDVNQPYEFVDWNGGIRKFTLLYNGLTNGCEFERYQKYCELYSLPYIVTDGNIPLQIAVSNELKKWSDNDLETTLVLFMNHSKVLPIASPLEIVNKYQKLSPNFDSIVIPSQGPTDSQIMMLCNASILQQIVSNFDSALFNLSSILTPYTDQLVVDKNCDIFYVLTENDEITFDQKKSRIINKMTNTRPCVIQSNEITNIMMNRIENYTGNGWNEYYGYRITKKVDDNNLPKVYVSFNIRQNFDNTEILNIIDYPSELLFTNKNMISNQNIEGFRSYPFEELMHHQEILNFMASDCEYYFFIDYNYVLKYPRILKELISLDKPIVAPLIRRGSDAWTNFWGDLDSNGYYKRSFDYIDIINGVKRGCWNVPYITGTYLMKRNVATAVPNIFIDNNRMDLDMRMCYNLRKANIFMYVSNISDYGQINMTKTIVLSQIPTNVNEVSLFEIFNRKDEWEKKYLHPLYYQTKHNLNELKYTELCDGIYTFPLFSETFCKEIMKLSEDYGKWSKGKDEHNDPRLGKNYYENVPTVDIQLFELGLDKQWKEMVFSYIAPVAGVLYNNYKTKDINLAFVVKYHYQDQASLAPHHDASTYTINVALNRGNGIDYDGGGCRFVRQNFVLKNQEPGMCSIHPGRLTAYHEGLPVTSGTRYILVSFIN